MPSLAIRSGQLITEEGVVHADIHSEDGTITSFSPASTLSSAEKTINAAGLLILPGLIDCHVHFREPGMTEAENFESGALAAFSGGITTVCDMPNTAPPTCTEAALWEKIQRAEKHASLQLPAVSGQRLGGRFDIRFFFGITRQEHLKELENVMEREELKKYIPGVKLYFGQSTGQLRVDPAILQDTFKLCTDLDLPLVCHCEDEGVIQRNLQAVSGKQQAVSTHSEIRSIEAAVKAVTRAIELARKFGTRLHIAHLSSAQELTLVQQAKRNGVCVTCEVAPHHLFLNTEDYNVLGTRAKMNPPLRTKDHCEALFAGVLDGTVDCLASDHAPHTLSSKDTTSPLDAPSGVPGVETMLPLLLSCVFGDGPRDSHGQSRLPTTHPPLHICAVLRLCFSSPNRIFRLGKTGITPGAPLDLIIVDPEVRWTIRGQDLHSSCGWTPYDGWEVQGKVQSITPLTPGS
jgi:dihydroorotase